MPQPTPPETAALPPSIQRLAARGTVKRFRRSTVLISEGETGDALYIVLDGSVKAYSVDERGREVVYGVYGAGEYLGEMSLDGGPRSASVMTLEPTTCAMITRQTLRNHIAEHPDFAFELIERFIRRVRTLTEITRSLALLDVYGRLVRLLDGMGVETADGLREIGPRPTHQVLAARVGSSREMVSRLLKDLERGGYIRAERTRLVLLRPLPAHW